MRKIRNLVYLSMTLVIAFLVFMEAQKKVQPVTRYPSVYKSAEGYAAVARAYDRVLKTWPVPYETRMVRTRYGETHVIICGKKDAPPLVLLHGGGNCALMWIYSVAGLSRHFRIYAPDTMGDIGMSSPSRDLIQVSDYVGWLSDTLDGLRLRRVNIAGVSWGGGIALSAALLAPQRVDRVVAMCPAWGLARPRMMTFMYHALPPAFFPSKERVRKLFQWLSVSKSAFTSPGDELFLDYLVVALKNYRMRKGNIWVFTDDELRSIKIPILLLFGDREVLYDARAVAGRARQLMQNAITENVPAAGHALFYDRPDIVNRRIIEFMGQGPV